MYETTSCPTAAERNASPRRAAWTYQPVAVVALLAIATYLYLGYRFGIPGQTSPLEYVLRYRGLLEMDWGTNFPSAHWVFTHLLALFPLTWLNEVAGIAWVVSLVLLGIGVVAIASALRIPLWTSLAVGLLVLVTRLGALGLSTAILGFLYPTSLAFAVVVTAIAALLWDRPVVFAVLLGVATLIHPAVGILSAIAVGPAAWLKYRSLKTVLGLALIFVATAGVSIYHLLAEQSATGELPAQEAYDLLAQVRIPHHLLYERFAKGEYAQTFAWTSVLFISAWILRTDRRVRTVAHIAAAIVVICVLGAIASLVDWPIAIVQAQTARLSPFLVLFGVLTGSAAVVRWNAALARFALPMLTTAAVIAGSRSLSVGSFVGAVGVLLLIGLRLINIPMIARVALIASRFAKLSALLVIGIFLLMARAGAPGDPVDEAAFRDVGHQARRLTRSDAVVLTPPSQSGFRYYSHRAIVVDFGVFRFGEGDAEWKQRIEDLTQDPRILDPEFSESVFPRLELIAAGYEKVIETSREPICTYRATHVVASASTEPPEYLKERYANDLFILYEVAENTCEGQ